MISVVITKAPHSERKFKTSNSGFGFKQYLDSHMVPGLACRTLQHDRETLQAESYARCAALAEELQATRASHREAVQNAQAELAASQQAAAAALASRPLPEDLEKASEAVQREVLVSCPALCTLSRAMASSS